MKLQNDTDLCLSDDGPHTPTIFSRLSTGRTSAAFLNLRHAALELDDRVTRTDDLFADAPREIRAQHSLHVASEQEPSGLWDMTKPMMERDACIWVFAAMAVPELLKGLKVYLAWYARSSILKTQFDEGSEELARRLLTGVTAVLLQVPNDPTVYVFVNSANDGGLNLAELSSLDGVSVTII
jgi:hypothetical protein